MSKNHPHSLKDPARIVKFVLRNTPGMEKTTRLAEITPYGYDYYELRGGLKNCRAKFERDREGRVVFLGGSITANTGWRDLVCQELEKRFPRAKFDFINAGIPSLGSTPHSFRFRRDVLKNGPVDLLFVEAAVNDAVNGQTPVEQVRGMEGIVRQARMANPVTDMIMLHFTDPEKVALISRGRTPEVIASHEKIAEHYAVPSLNLAREIAERIHAGEFNWQDDFKDLHPSPFGHGIYFRSLVRLFNAAWRDPLAKKSGRQAHPLPARPVDAHSYFRGRLVEVQGAVSDSGWNLVTAWKPSDNAITRPGFVNVPVLVSTQPGAVLKFKFKGTAVGIFVISGPDTGAVAYRVDKGPFLSRNLYTKWSGKIHLPWAQMLSAGLAPKTHVLELKLAGSSGAGGEHRAVRIVYFLVNCC